MSIQIKTAAVTGPKTCEILELTTPDLGRGEVLVKVHAVALCTLEQRIFRGEVKMPCPAPAATRWPARLPTWALASIRSCGQKASG